MKSKLLILISCLFAYHSILAQDEATSLRVYEILQAKCASCHSNVDPRAGLDLEGSGNSIIEKALSVYNNVVGVTPKNTATKDKGYEYIRPGRVDKSFLFKKINQGLDRNMSLEDEEGEPMPLSGSLTDVEKELVRQWILWGAPMEGTVVEESILEEYYAGNGNASFPAEKELPAAPDPSEGFQLKMGPFFMSPSGEKELFLKYQLDNETDIEVNRVEVEMSNFSHHFIIYDYGTPAEGVPEGLRFDQDHTSDVNFVASVAEPSDIRLPERTAYFWGPNHVLDLNSHYINYSTDQVYQSEVYINVYTQEAGTAVQEMRSNLLPNVNIDIPNTGDIITQTSILRIPAILESIIPQEIFVWNMGAHTHKYGAGYKIWTMTEDGEKEDLIYDGSCPGGVPDCIAPFFDYQHIPIRTWDEFLPVNLGNGITHEAKYINDGPEPVRWGPTSKDEMMLFGVFYVTDTTGLNSNITTATNEVDPIFEGVKVFPNPMTDYATILLPADLGKVTFTLYDMMGSVLSTSSNNNNTYIRVEREALPKGMYLFTLEDEEGRVYSDKLLMQ